MFDVLNHDETVNSDDSLQPANYVVRRYDEKLDDAIRMDVARQADLDGSYPDFWKPVEDWRLD